VRTAVNVTGDATVSVIVGKSEKQFEEQVWLNPNADLQPNTDDPIEQETPTA
jgi:Na+/H+-dicarboxylate symporter